MTRTTSPPPDLPPSSPSASFHQPSSANLPPHNGSLHSTDDAILIATAPAADSYNPDHDVSQFQRASSASLSLPEHNPSSSLPGEADTMLSVHQDEPHADQPPDQLPSVRAPPTLQQKSPSIEPLQRTPSFLQHFRFQRSRSSKTDFSSSDHIALDVIPAPRRTTSQRGSWLGASIAAPLLPKQSSRRLGFCEEEEELKGLLLQIYEKLEQDEKRVKEKEYSALFESISQDGMRVSVSGGLGDVLIRLGIRIELDHLHSVIHQVCQAQGREPDNWVGTGIALKQPVYHELTRQEFVDVMDIITKKNDSKHRLLRASQMFARLDSDKAGALDCQKLTNFLEHNTINFLPERLSTIMEVVVGSGKDISFEKFLLLMGFEGVQQANFEDMEVQNRRARLLEAVTTFHTFDEDGSGTIDTAELTGIMKTMGQKMTHEEVEEMFALADKHGTGEIDFENFCELLSSRRHN
eukprot:749301-Hanusia_phi.AAC.2